jgi:hypothetical protein
MITTSEKEACGFQGIDNLNTPQIKRWLAIYLLYNQQFASAEEKEKAINSLYVKAMLFFQETDMRVNEKNISNPDIGKKIMDFAKMDIKEIETILEKKAMETQTETTSSTEQTATTSNNQPQTSNNQPQASTTEKKPCGCGCGGHDHEDKPKLPSEVEALHIALLVALILLFLGIRYLYYVLGGIALLYVGYIGYRYLERKKEKEEKEAQANETSE